MSDKIKDSLSLFPESVDSAVKNLTDAPTHNIGTTLADIWFLVFGGISQAADKRRLKYSYALNEFEKELKTEVSKIPEDKKCEPDMQVVAPALEDAKYCVEKQELRTLFAKLIAASINTEKNMKIHPLFPDIIKRMSSSDALLLLKISAHKNFDGVLVVPLNYENLVHSVLTLENLGLIFSDYKEFHFCYVDRNYEVKFFIQGQDSEQTIKVSLTKIGIQFLEICS